MLNTVGYGYRDVDDPNTVITLSNIAIAMGNHKTVVTWYNIAIAVDNHNTEITWYKIVIVKDKITTRWSLI